MKLSDPSFVYVMEGEAGGPIKVGRAKDPWARARDLQTGNPYTLRVLHVLIGDHELEWQLHHRLKDSRLQGEWFHGPAVPEFLEFIQALAKFMVSTFMATGQLPAFQQFGGEWKLHGRAEVTIKFAEPMPSDELEAIRSRKREETAQVMKLQRARARALCVELGIPLTEEAS
jgi:hypothetical protein